jgi:protein-S-isoprenylcysteine O-methyltransferase Ste14
MLAMVTRPRQPRCNRGDPRWLLAGYAGLVGFFALEALFRQPGGASSLNASEDDRGTTRLIIAAYGLAADLPLVARWLPGRRLPPASGPAGLVMQVAGLAVRAWSMRVLGTSYSRTLRTDHDGQALIDSGPYRLIRHPGYLGSLLTWTGFALTSRSASVVALTSSLLGAAYGKRITAEEQLLQRDLPGYATYSQRTKKLVPFIW